MSGERPHILLIDDDLDMHDVVKLILQPVGYRVTCRATAPAGMEALRNEQPDLLLLDIMLATPTEGFELADQIRADSALQDLPIIVVSCTPRDSGFESPNAPGVARAGPELFLEKPLDAGKLRQAVADVLRRCLGSD